MGSFEQGEAKVEIQMQLCPCQKQFSDSTEQTIWRCPSCEAIFAGPVQIVGDDLELPGNGGHVAKDPHSTNGSTARRRLFAITRLMAADIRSGNNPFIGGRL